MTSRSRRPQYWQVAGFVAVVVFNSAFYQSKAIANTTNNLKNIRKISLGEALQIASKQNLTVRTAILEKEISEEIVAEKKDERLPNVDLHGSYALMSNMMEYPNGLNSEGTFIHTIREIYDLTANAKVPIYLGGQIKNTIHKSEQQAQVAEIKAKKAEKDVHNEVINHYLQICKLLQMQTLLAENIKEEQDRLHEIQSLRKNNVVTADQLIRAQFQLSQMQLLQVNNRRGVAMATHRLHTLLQLPEEDTLVIDTAQVMNIPLQVANYQTYLEAAMTKEEVQMAKKEEYISEIDLKNVRAGYMPQINGFGTFGYNYPNYMLFLFPPHPYLYSLGRAGIDLSWSVSNLYKNRKRVHTAHQQVNLKKLKTNTLKEQTRDLIFDKYTQLQEMNDRIPITQTAIAQAQENYRIIKKKYLNGLAISTEMIDADNALLQARYDYVAARIEAINQYYQLLHAAGLPVQDSSSR